MAGGYQLAYLNLWWSRMAREAKRDQEDRQRVEDEQKKMEILKEWFKPKRILDDDMNVSLISTETKNFIEATIQEVSCWHPLQVHSELEGGYLNCVGSVLSPTEETIYEHTQTGQPVMMQVLDNTFGDWHQEYFVEGLGSDRVMDKRDSDSTC